MNNFYVRYDTEDGTPERLTQEQLDDPDRFLPENARVYDIQPLTSQHESATGRSVPYTDLAGNVHPCPPGLQWRVNHDGLRNIEEMGRMVIGNNGRLNWKRYEDEMPGTGLNAVWNDGSRVRNRRYIVETPARILERVILMTTDPGDLVLDPTCGSGAVPLQAERWGRRWIAIDSSAVSTAIARERIVTAIHPYYLLLDSPDGHRREHELAEDLHPSGSVVALKPKTLYRHDPSQGFVLARQLRVSAATLAYGFTPDDVILHPDRPEVDRTKCRVSSPFTVESDLPFSSVRPDISDGPSVDPVVAYGDLTETMRNLEDALRTGGIKLPGTNGSPSTTYSVADLELTVEIPDVTHIGHIADQTGSVHDAVFYLCGEGEVAGPFQTRNLAVAARHRGAGYACVVGFGHEGDIGSLARHQGNLTILQVRAKRDLMIPGLEHRPDDDALVVISEPDLAVHEESGGKVSIEVRGLTTYNPVTGQVEPTGDRRVAGILTDTNYDQESFMVSLFNLPTGAISERRLRQIRDSFRREIDESKWQRMRSTRTLPFVPPPTGGKVAVKVIDHTGMEHMRVLDWPHIDSVGPPH